MENPTQHFVPLVMQHARLTDLRTTLASLVLSVASVFFSAQSFAADTVVERLRAFTADTQSFSADFEQSLYNGDSELLKNDTGKLLLKRPGKFIWRYEGGSGQEFISNGKTLWMYDKELEQATVNVLDERLKGTPLVLLLGGAAIEDQFEITSLGSSDGIDWLELIPKDSSNDFESLFVGLNELGLAALELRDNLGQATQIQFSNVELGLEYNDDQFSFVAPEGVDVIGEPAQ